MKFSLIAALLGFGVCACVTTRAELPEAELTLAERAAQRLPLEVCRRDRIEEDLLCGTFDAPLNWDDPDGPRLGIAVVVIPALDGNPGNRAWTEHQGGPGRRMLGTASFFTNTEAGRRFRRKSDVVLFDQRGVGESGGLYCEALNQIAILEPYFTAEKVGDCRAELEAQGIDLSAYSTLTAVKDLEGIRQWLGYEQFDVAGWSYGSRFMLTYANAYPDRVRTMMLAVPAPFDYARPVDWALFSQRAINGIARDCAADPDCSAAFPDVAGDLAVALELARTSPAEVAFTDPYTGETRTALMTPERVIEEVHVALLKVGASRYLPLVLRAAAEGDFEPLVLLAVPERAPSPIAEAQYLSVVCAEEVPFYTLEEAERGAEGSFVGMHFAQEYKDSCAVWGLPKHPEYPLDWRRPDVPTLIFAGGRDPITPVEYGAAIANSLDNVRLIYVEAMPHDFAGLDGAQCFEQMMLQFRETASVLDLDISCVKSLAARPFVTEEPQR